MLEELRIRHLGVIDDATMQLDRGLTVVTGETGAGKTMVVTGLHLLFGGRADSAQVRTGADQASIEGRISAVDEDSVAQRLSEAGGELDEDGTLLLRRSITATGRSRGHAGGASVPIGVLADLGERLLAIHGQSGQLRLVRPAEQRAALDRYAGIDLTDYRGALRAWLDAEEVWHTRVRDAATLSAEADVLRHGLEEIEKVDPQPGEDDELAGTASRLAHVDGLRLAARGAHDALVGATDDPGSDAVDVQSLLAAAQRELSQVNGADPELDGLSARFADVAATAADLGVELAAYESGLEADPELLAATETRRAELSALVRRYGRPADSDGTGGVSAVLAWAKQAAARHAEIDVSDEALDALAASRDVARDAAAEQARAISARRREVAAALSDAVSAELSGLAMAGARLEVVVDARPAVAGQPALRLPKGPPEGHSAGMDGVDEVNFLLQADPSAPGVPLHRGASGGELSRVMLALEVVLADTDPVPTMIFDEVDAGVGGRAAVEVGRRLARLARSRQVIVVTHLAQVAAYAGQHLVVDKATGADGADGITSSSVRAVSAADREAELARMLAGQDTRTARRHAAELLAQAHSDRG
ncbi:MAG: DNA repair protein RecN [Jatrophihabitans sp.]